MKMMRSSVVLEYKLVSSFESIRKKLLSDKFADRLEKPLAYWALPNDRRLPLAFMGRTLKELLDTPFKELYSTAGIGQKKISSLIDLLVRAAKPHPPGTIVPRDSQPGANENASLANAAEGLAMVDPSMVSEALWVQWRATVVKHGLQGETLGRMAHSLENLPRVIWNTTLEAYTHLTLAEIRSLKTHGEKRVNAVLEIFGHLHAMLVHMPDDGHLNIRIVPKFVTELEKWAQGVLAGNQLPSDHEIRTAFVEPLVAQVHLDAGELIAGLVESRLRLTGNGTSVRQTARRMGLTRARVYQLLNDASAVLAVRWPEGRACSAQLAARFKASASPVDPTRFDLFLAAIELFFPAASLELLDGADDDGSKLSSLSRLEVARRSLEDHEGTSGRMYGGPKSPVANKPAASKPCAPAAAHAGKRELEGAGNGHRHAS